MNTQPTVAIMLDTARSLEESAQEIRRKAEELAKTGDWSLAGEALNTLSNLFGGIRFDLFAIRPLRECGREIMRLSDKRTG